MASEKIVQMPKTADVFANGGELVLEALAQASKARAEAAQVTRDGLEKLNGLVRAGGQTALDLYDFGVKMNETWFSMVEEAVKNANSSAKKLQKLA